MSDHITALALALNQIKVPKFKLGDKVRIIKYGSLIFQSKTGYQSFSDSLARFKYKEDQWLLFSKKPTEEELKKIKGRSKPDNIYCETEDSWWIDISPSYVGKVGIVKKISNTQNIPKYSLKDIDAKTAWYDEEQLELA